MSVLFISVLILVGAATVDADTCAGCTSTYETAKGADGATNAQKCTALKNYLTCLVDATSCPLTTEKANAIGSDLTGLGSDCSLNDVCTCQKVYWETDQSADEAAVCTATTAYYHCLTGKTNAACDGTSTVKDLATAVESRLPTSCSEKTDTCDCQIAYTKTDVSDDRKRCTAAIVYHQCVDGTSNNGCDDSTNVDALKAAAVTTIDGITSCSLTAKTCDVCTSEYESAVSGADDTAKCNALKSYMTCLEGAAFCPLTATKATAIGTAYTAISSSCTLTEACKCQKDYWKTDLTGGDSAKCSAAKTRISCLVGQNDVACDGSATVKSLADSSKTVIDGISTCSKTDVCVCEIAYVTTDISSTRCTATKTITTCIQESIQNGCGSSSTKTTVGTAIQAAFTEMTTCEVTQTCQCQINFNKATVNSATTKCKASDDLTTCLDNSTSVACDGDTTVANLKTTLKTNVTDVICSTAGLKVGGSYLISPIILITSVLIISS